MGFSAAVKACFRKYFTFSGRAGRPEYWWFVLFIALGSVIATVVDGTIFGFGSPEEPATRVVYPAFSLATLVPLLAAGWRRLHDTGRPGWYLLIPLVVSTVIGLGLLLGVFGFTKLEIAGADEETLRIAASGFGIAGVAIAGIIQLVLAVLILWWLTRPTQAGANEYGDERSL